jgi:hypothetical protein
MSAKQNSITLFRIQSKIVEAEPGTKQRETILEIGDKASEIGRRQGNEKPTVISILSLVDWISWADMRYGRCVNREVGQELSVEGLQRIETGEEE